MPRDGMLLLLSLLLLTRRLKRECQFMLIILVIFASESAKINFVKKFENPAVV